MRVIDSKAGNKIALDITECQRAISLFGNQLLNLGSDDIAEPGSLREGNSTITTTNNVRMTR